MRSSRSVALPASPIVTPSSTGCDALRSLALICPGRRGRNPARPRGRHRPWMRRVRQRFAYRRLALRLEASLGRGWPTVNLGSQLLPSGPTVSSVLRRVKPPDWRNANPGGQRR